MHRHAAFFHALFIKKQYSTAETDLINVEATLRLIYGYVVSFSISCPIATNPVINAAPRACLKVLRQNRLIQLVEDHLRTKNRQDPGLL